MTDHRDPTRPEHLELLEDDAPDPFPHAWLVALIAWDHDAHAHLAPRRDPSGLVRAPNGHPAVLLAVVRALGEPSPLDVTAAELTAAAEHADLTDAQHAEAPAALTSFTAWACRHGVLEGNPLPAPTDPAPLRLLRPEAAPGPLPAPDYLTAARAEHHCVTRDPDAEPAAVLAAEDRLQAAILDARAEGHDDHPEH